MNIQVLDMVNTYNMHNLTDKFGQLEWLQKTFDYAEKHNETILLLSHYAPYTNYMYNGKAHSLLLTRMG